jgi:hypothetical protein
VLTRSVQGMLSAMWAYDKSVTYEAFLPRALVISSYHK